MGDRKIKQEVNKFIKENLNVEVEAKKVYRLKIKENTEIVVTELDSETKKRSNKQEEFEDRNLDRRWSNEGGKRDTEAIKKESKRRKDKKKEDKSRIYENIY